MEKLYTMQEICEAWQTSDATILRAVKKGDMEAIKLGSSWRFTEEQLTRFLEKRTVSWKSRRKLAFKKDTHE